MGHGPRRSLRDLVPVRRAHPACGPRAAIPWSAAREAADGVRRRRCRTCCRSATRGFPSSSRSTRWCRSTTGWRVRDDVFLSLTNVVDGRTWGVPWYADTAPLLPRRPRRACRRRRAAGGVATGWRCSAGSRGAPGRTTRRSCCRCANEDAGRLALQRGATLLKDDGTRGDFAKPARGAFAFYLDLFTRGVARRDAADAAHERLP